MSSTRIVFDETEHDLVRKQVINQILYLNLGLRRGLNHDLINVGCDEEDLIRYFLAKDKLYQLLKNRSRYNRCVLSADQAETRRSVFEDVIVDMIDNGGLYCLSDMWSLKPSLTDSHRKAGQHRRKNAVAFNDNSYHGRPRRDRNRPLAHVA